MPMDERKGNGMAFKPSKADHGLYDVHAVLPGGRKIQAQWSVSWTFAKRTCTKGEREGWRMRVVRTGSEVSVYETA